MVSSDEEEWQGLPEEVDIGPAHAPVKDASELELEKLVFGDELGFRDKLNAHAAVLDKPQRNGLLQTTAEAVLGLEDVGGLNAVQDADVSYLGHMRASN
jgi:hypothetical protein